MQKAQQFCCSVASRQPSPLLSLLTPSSSHRSTHLRYIIPSIHKSSIRYLSSTRCLMAPENTNAQTSPSRDYTSTGKGGISSSAKTGDRNINEDASTEDPPADTRQYIDQKLRSRPVPTWGAPMAGVQRSSKVEERQNQINELLKQTTRAPARGSGASRSSSSADLLRERSPLLTPTARRQEALAKNADLMGPLMIDKHLFGHEHQRIDPPPPVRVDAYMGRAQVVDRNDMPLGRALVLLGMRVKQNNVKNDWYAQRFHERNGMKRKRLKSERWRARFKDGFKHMIKKVRKMRAQGW